jgi:C-terminal processing protease CtpA/Prc
MQTQDKLRSGADEHKLTEKLVSKLGDKYTRILDKATYESLWKYDAIGVGVLFESSPAGQMVIASAPIEGSSGAEAKLNKGDFILAVNRVSTKGMTAIQLLDMISNDDDSVLTLQVERQRDEDSVVVQGGEGRTSETLVLKRSKQKAINPVTFTPKVLSDGSKVSHPSCPDSLYSQFSTAVLNV